MYRTSPEVFVVPAAGLEPARHKPRDFKSPVSTIPPRGHVIENNDNVAPISGDIAPSERAQETCEVGTDAQIPAHDHTPIPMAASSPLTRARFFAKVDRSGDCWEWTASTTGKGYGRIRVCGSRAQFRAHRISYFLHYGVDPGPLLVCHTCDNPKCVNPEHLFLGTVADNSADMVQKGRHRVTSRPGDTNPNAKLTDEGAREIVRLIMSGLSNKQIAERCAVGHSMVSRIRAGRSWRNLSESMGYEPKPGKTAPKSGRTKSKLVR